MKEKQEEPQKEQRAESQGDLGIAFPAAEEAFLSVNKTPLQRKATHLSTSKGSADLHDHGSAAKLYNLEVGSAKRGGGGGKELVHKASQEAIAMGKKKLLLDSEDNGTGKLDNWYKKQGFKAIGQNNGMNSFELPLQRKESSSNSTKNEKPPLQLKTENKTGLPDNLKSGIERLSGYSMEDVRVHRNSSKPAQLQAYAYAQGTNIHLGPGQERHLPHEAWHVVQQKQGRVKPTLQMKTGHLINDNEGLEREADVMGERAARLTDQYLTGKPTQKNQNGHDYPVQRMMKKLGVDKEKYKKLTMNTVYLYAEYDGHSLGVFKTENSKHAEENLIDYMKSKNLSGGKLVVYLSTSPCSSVFCTRTDGSEGCQERLEEFASDSKVELKVHADHLYQPQALASQEADFLTKGVSSFSSAATSAFDITFSKLPKKLHDESLLDNLDGTVAQLKQKAIIQSAPTIQMREKHRISKQTTPYIHAFTFDAIENGAPSRLTYLINKDSSVYVQDRFGNLYHKSSLKEEKSDKQYYSIDLHSLNRKKALSKGKQLNGKSKIKKDDLSRDEYPYASSYEGGTDSFWAFVPKKEQSTQGGQLSALYKKVIESGDPVFDVELD